MKLPCLVLSLLLLCIFSCIKDDFDEESYYPAPEPTDLDHLSGKWQIESRIIDNITPIPNLIEYLYFAPVSYNNGTAAHVADGDSTTVTFFFSETDTTITFYNNAEEATFRYLISPSHLTLNREATDGEIVENWLKAD